MGDIKDSFFLQHAKHYKADEQKATAYPFKDHIQFGMLVDILSRKYSHHTLLTMAFPATIHHFFFEAFAQHLSNETTPHTLKHAELIYLDLENAAIPLTKHKSIEDELERLRSSLSNATQYKVFILPASWLLANEAKQTDDRFIRKQIKILLAHPMCRFIAITDQSLPLHNEDSRLIALTITPPNDGDMMAILKQQRTELEDFHDVIIPEELLGQAYNLAERFLSATNTLEHALLLLDSCAARVATLEHQTAKSVLTSSHLLQVLSSWTHIPPASFQMHKFRIAEFTQHLQQRIFGQDLAINIIGQELQQAQANLKRRQGPFCSFLFAGPTHCGKKTTAVAMVEDLFKQTNILFFAQPTLTQTSLSEMKVQSANEKRYLSLGEVIQQMPYAIIVFDHVEQAAPAIIDGLQEIVSTGYLHDAGKQFNFKQAIIILSTSKGTEQLTTLHAIHPDETEDEYTMDLMQLIMSEQKQQKYANAQQPSTQEIRNKLLPVIADTIPQALYHHLQFVPFLPLTKESAENIVRLKVKQLGKQLDARYGIEIGYAPEVTRFLANEIVYSQSPEHASTNPDHVLKQLYFCVEQALLSPAENKNRSNQLFLQLNETGNILRSEWVALTTRQHAS